MQKIGDQLLFSASDVCNYLECEHLTVLDLINLETPLPKTAEDDEARLIQDKGHAHEAEFLAHLRSIHESVIDISTVADSTDSRVAATRKAMRDGYDIIYQATLRGGPFIGYADFLRRVQRPSALGDWSYEVLDTKLARSAKAKFIMQLSYYSDLVARIQGASPQLMHVVLGDNSEATYRCADYAHYVRHVQRCFIEWVGRHSPDTYPHPCEKCDQCRWQELCEKKRLDDDHLCQVANITRLQINKLQAAGVPTLEALALLAEEIRIPKMTSETREKLRSQAALQHRARQDGQRHLELLQNDATDKGFARMPAPDAGDLFFDMEGNPLEDGGLEYLFGVYFFENGKPEFKAFWAHDRQQEKLAFEQFMDFVMDRLRHYPAAYIYHYAHYEQTALKKLMSLHGRARRKSIICCAHRN